MGEEEEWLNNLKPVWGSGFEMPFWLLLLWLKWEYALWQPVEDQANLSNGPAIYMVYTQSSVAIFLP